MRIMKKIFLYLQNQQLEKVDLDNSPTQLQLEVIEI